MDATRQTFLDELYAHGRAHDERARTGSAPAQRRARDRRAARRARARHGRHARARGRHLQRLLDDLARRRRRGRRRHGPLARDRGRAHRPGRRQPRPRPASTASSSCARRTPPRRCAAFDDGAFDLIFLDAERREYAGYWPDLSACCAPNGLLVVDNTLSHAKELVEFSELVYSARGRHLDAGHGRRGRAADRQVAVGAVQERAERAREHLRQVVGVLVHERAADHGVAAARVAELAA